jgi:hypothetical protein
MCMAPSGWCQAQRTASDRTLIWLIRAAQRSTDPSVGTRRCQLAHPPAWTAPAPAAAHTRGHPIPASPRLPCCLVLGGGNVRCCDWCRHKSRCRTRPATVLAKHDTGWLLCMLATAWSVHVTPHTFPHECVTLDTHSTRRRRDHSHWTRQPSLWSHSISSCHPRLLSHASAARQPHRSPCQDQQSHAHSLPRMC